MDYFGARYYDPEIGIFTSTDPAEQFWNSYSYCGGDPITGIDPDGTENYYNSDGSLNCVMAIQDPDNSSMFMMGNNGGLSLLGDMGGNVNITYMFDQMLQNNGALAQQMSSVDFYNAVKTGGIWDFKDQKGNYQLQYQFENWDFDDPGNYHFGYVAEKFGLNPVIAQMGAGLYQIKSGTSSWNFGGSYFDDPRDSKMIGRGYNAATRN